MPPEFRKAESSDVRGIHALISHYASNGKLLPRSVYDVRRNLSKFFVAIEGAVVVGCVCLDVYGKKMAEIRSLAVAEHARGQGIGQQLVKLCVNEAKRRHVLEVMAITSVDHFFKSSGFDYTLPGERKALFINP